VTDIDLTDGNDKGRHVQPQGFIPSHLAEPMLRDSRRTALEYAAEGLGDIRLSAAIMDGPLAAKIEAEATRLQRLVKALAAGALAALVLTVGLAAGPSAGSAQAAEGPEPDPVAAVAAPATVRVVLGAAGATARARVTTPNVTPRGLRCASVWATSSVTLRLGPARLGHACSYRTSFTVPVTLDRYTPLGRSILAVTDDVAPMNTTPARVVLIVRRPSKFGLGTWTPTYYGDGLTVSATLYAYTPAAGAWTPQRNSPVKVQELRAGRWVTVTTLTTNGRGVFTGSVTLGGGLHTVRVVRPQGATVTATVGTAHTFYLVPTDVPVDVI
jgi:hypothetical protein